MHAAMHAVPICSSKQPGSGNAGMSLVWRGYDVSEKLWDESCVHVARKLPLFVAG